MKRTWALAGILGFGGFLGAGIAPARGQTIVMPGPQVVYAPASVGGYATVPTDRRDLRRSNRYNTLRPAFGNRAAVTFAPYSDRYFPTANAPLAPTAYYLPARPTSYRGVAPR